MLPYFNHFKKYKSICNCLHSVYIPQGNIPHLTFKTKFSEQYKRIPARILQYHTLSIGARYPMLNSANFDFSSIEQSKRLYFLDAHCGDHNEHL